MQPKRKVTLFLLINQHPHSPTTPTPPHIVHQAHPNPEVPSHRNPSIWFEWNPRAVFNYLWCSFIFHHSPSSSRPPRSHLRGSDPPSGSPR